MSVEIHNVDKNTSINKVASNIGFKFDRNDSLSPGATAAKKYMNLQSQNPKSGYHGMSSNMTAIR